MYSFPDLEPVCCSMFSSNCCFLTCIQISQEAGQVVWYFHLSQNFPLFIVIHTVKGFGIVNKAEVDVFQELCCFFDDPADVGNLITGSSAFSKSRLNIWSSWFTYFWSLAWRILSITLLACSPGDLPNPGIKPRSPALQVDSLPAEPQGKPNNAGVGSLSLLQGIFPTQESNQSLLHFRQILYQLSYERLSLSAQLLFPTMAIINILPTLWPSDSRTFLSELSEYCFPLHQETVSIMWGFF